MAIHRGKTFGPKRNIEKYLSNEHKILSWSLKKRLIKEKYFEEKCMSCSLTHWLNNPIPLELHHIDGNHFNNNLSNLQLLCPNCHAMTPNYRGKNKSNVLVTKKDNIEPKIKKEKIVKIKVKKPQQTKIEWPSVEEISKLVWLKPTSILAQELGVSDKAIDKFCKKNNISKPARGYWAKKLYNKSP